MPPRFAYWTILIDGKPTAFRAHLREELQPTFHQLQRTNADVVMKWFSGGTLWDSPDAARAARAERMRTPAPKRAADWRPGGEHKDPRDRFKKKSRQARDRPPYGDRPRFDKPADGKPRFDKPADGKPRFDKPTDGKPRFDRPADGKPRFGKPADGKPRFGKPADRPRFGTPRGSTPRFGKPRPGGPQRRGGPPKKRS